MDASLCGQPGLYRKLLETAPKTKEVRFLDEALYDLHDEVLETLIRKTVIDVRGYVAFGVTDLMGQTDKSEDWKVVGSPTNKAWTSFVETGRVVHVAALDKIIKALKPLASPWGFWRRPSTRLWTASVSAARKPFTPPKPLPIARASSRRRLRRSRSFPRVSG